MSKEILSSPVKTKLPLQGVVIFVSQQLATSRTTLHEQCTALGGKFVWVFDVPFTHYICQGKLSKRGKEYKKAIEHRALCVHPAWLKACQKFGQRVAEKLYATTYDPNRSLTFISAGDDDDDDDDEEEENHLPSLTTIKSTSSLKLIQTPRIIPIINKKKKPHITTVAPTIEISSPRVIPSVPKQSSQISNEAETMLNDLESSLAQFLNHNNSNSNSNASISRPSMNDDEQNKKSLQIIRSISNINYNNTNNGTNIEPSMRVEWLDDAMQAERKKMIDEDEHGISSQQQSLCEESKIVLKRPLVDSNFNQSFNAKKCRT
ncbi:unnamed protein product [Rotaria sordida]|uniref:BRCT domain-containing protein n=1 Tax=Rotaria sordida TaxID=392033 RepID=A0A813NSM0_9BILA|nr:unnamed protein product [Rotaria sordida]CAF3485079.1 unnamed protein product [Rotaria sordida]